MNRCISALKCYFSIFWANFGILYRTGEIGARCCTSKGLMATSNVRIVGYLPPDYHKKLREYMENESLTESAALVRIIRQFFDGAIAQPKATPERSSDATASLKAEMASLQQRLSVLEQVVASGAKRGRTSFTKTVKIPPPTLPPQSEVELARRFGVNPNSISEAVEKGEEYFFDWSRRRDPGKKAWQKRDNLFYPLSE